MWIKNTKYGSVKQTYNGYAYHSRLEANYAAELDLRKKAKDIKSWERQVRIPLTLYGKTIGHYVIDFVITHNDGTEEFVEVKGFETTIWRWKWKHLEVQFAKENPKARLTIVR